TYYWRVRAKDDKGVWGPWSRTWSFTAHAPTPPLDVTLDHDPERGVGTLRWKPNPVGRQPAKYRVYGSDEMAFSVSDEPYRVNLGATKDKLANPFPANFVAETPDTELVVVGVGLNLPNANKAFYRVVAVDERGKRSWSSDYVAAPRPFIYSRPVTAARVGQQYGCSLAAIRSLGDARNRGKEGMGFWDIEEPKFALEQAPPWLKIDKDSGLLSGTPDAAGRAEVVVTATIDREVRQLNEGDLSWGTYKVVSTSVERVGTAAQQFVIDVSE
ncbi:MAG: putative Ig domain-containing protein, partial [Candidatus Brocadiae bacterium]|nr:putative Ig domain-containing protein [Candidatus Brocadiia bacterium]